MRHVQVRISREEMKTSLDSYAMVQLKLKAFGFDLTQTYSMYYDEGTDSYVYFQKERVLH